jgi:hypothetical protein
MVVIDACSHSEHVQVIRCDFKPGSVERSRDVKNKAILEKNNDVQLPLNLGIALP